MKNNITEIRVCRKCGKPYSTPPAFSLTCDSDMLDCGTVRLSTASVSSGRAEKILNTIHEHTNRSNIHVSSAKDCVLYYR